MHMIRLGHLVTLAVLTACAQPSAISASADLQTASVTRVADGQGEDAAQGIANTYDRVCLASFPDEAKLQASLGSLGAVALSQAEVRMMLHADPGRGWRRPGTPFTVTVESPPYRTCAVRRMTRDGIPTAKPYIAVVNAYARQRGICSRTCTTHRPPAARRRGYAAVRHALIAAWHAAAGRNQHLCDNELSWPVRSGSYAGCRGRRSGWKYVWHISLCRKGLPT